MLTFSLSKSLSDNWFQNKLNFTIGLPQCGKSTFAQEWKDTNRVVVNGDNFRLAGYG
ncbi:hypothetical protein LCGC14_1410750, partial [marine sediment metagenome]